MKIKIHRQRHICRYLFIKFLFRIYYYFFFHEKTNISRFSFFISFRRKILNWWTYQTIEIHSCTRTWLAVYVIREKLCMEIERQIKEEYKVQSILCQSHLSRYVAVSVCLHDEKWKRRRRKWKTLIPNSREDRVESFGCSDESRQDKKSLWIFSGAVYVLLGSHLLG